MNRDGALAAMAHLIGLGHRRIGFVTGRPDLESARRRLLGYEDALHEAGIPVDQALIEAGDFTRETGFACAQRLLALPQPPTAIFAANDQSAFGAIEAAQEAGLRVPNDLSVVGFDNIPEATYFSPPLTTIDQFIDEMGYVAAEILIGLVQGEPLESDLYKMPTQLIVRDSCRAIAGGS
jgi:LacI family transcriptional regulator